MSKLDNLDSRIHRLEDHLIFQPHPSPHHSPLHAQDPKGKAPMVSPMASPTPTSPDPSPRLSPAPTPHVPSPQSSSSAQKSSSHQPLPVSSKSSSSSSHSDPQQFELAAYTPTTPSHSPFIDSEATPSDLSQYVTPPPSPPPPPPPPPPTSPSQPSPSPRAAPTSYRCRKMVVLKPGSPLHHHRSRWFLFSFQESIYSDT